MRFGRDCETIKEMAATKRKSKSSSSHAGYDDAFDSFVELIGSVQRSECASAARELLQKSSSYNRMVDKLNRAYVSAAKLDKSGGLDDFKPDDDGKLTVGDFANRYTLAIGETPGTSQGNRFLRAGAFQTRTTAFARSDWISLMFPEVTIDSPERRGKVIAQLSASIAHETVHAFHRVTESPPATPLTRAERADAFIKEEVATRETEKAILKELLSLKVGTRMALETFEKKKNSKGMRELIKNRVETIQLERAEVERDFISGTDLTYLETFVVEDMLKKSMRVKKGDQIVELDEDTIEKNKDLVNRLVFTLSIEEVVQKAHPELYTEDPKSGLKTVFLPNQFSELLLIRRIIEEHWRESGTGDRESIVQSHRDAFFPQEIHYTDLP